MKKNNDKEEYEGHDQGQVPPKWFPIGKNSPGDNAAHNEKTKTNPRIRATRILQAKNPSPYPLNLILECFTSSYSFHLSLSIH